MNHIRTRYPRSQSRRWCSTISSFLSLMALCHIYELYICALPSQAEIKEEDRLSAFVKLMDYETAIGPRIRISKFDALKLESYLHYRLPDSDIGFVPTTLICPPGGDRPLQFMEPISKDYPPGTWTLQADSLQEVITIQFVVARIQVLLHSETGEYNSLYMGYGERNDDLPFMILD
ncbi:radial spoke head protein 9 [Caerostris extrusa]|uniref:Radial spoke head protein 9 homolog n=1 Tax=Caerostris extrusa TaxID=172846 RepID=A0AAV4SAT1_CAEEX|nr:radial spoke head protein 9 [Caerostris extrusa]